MAVKKVVVGSKKIKTQLVLPQDTTDLLKNLELKERKAYIARLCKGGWTYQSIGNALGVSRQAVEQYVESRSVKEGEGVEAVKDLPIPNLPTKPIYKSQRVEAEADVIALLKELHSKASQVRSSSTKYRAEAEQFTKLAWEQTQKGISVYSLAKSLGLSNGALMFRFVRYGYKTSNGKSKSYKKIIENNREK